MAIKALEWARRQRVGSASKKVLLLVIADRVKDGEWVMWAGQDALAEETELGVRTVVRLLAELECMGVIERQHRRRPDGYRTSDMIRLNLAWEATSPATESGDSGSPDSVATSSDQDIPPHLPQSHLTSATTSPANDCQSHLPQWQRGDGKLEPEVEPLCARADEEPPAPGCVHGTPPDVHCWSCHIPPGVAEDDDPEPASLLAAATGESGFDAFMAAFPKQQNIHRARPAWRWAIGRARPEVIIEAAQRYARHVAAHRPTFVWLPDVWLRDQHWEDNYELNLPRDPEMEFERPPMPDAERRRLRALPDAELGTVGAGSQSA